MSAHTTGEYPYSVFPSPQGKNGMQANPSPAAKIHQPDYSGQADVFVFSIDLCDFPSKIEVLKCVDYNYDFPAVVDGHITIVRFKEANLTWYTAAFLLTANGQNQLYRYINGSSGQVEIYPQDISRIWIAPASPEKIVRIATAFKNACNKQDEFYRDLTAAVNEV